MELAAGRAHPRSGTRSQEPLYNWPPLLEEVPRPAIVPVVFVSPQITDLRRGPRGTDRPSHPQGHGEPHDVAVCGCLRCVSVLEEKLDRAPAELVVRDRDGCQLRSGPQRERIVVERDDRDVRRDGQSGVGESVEGTECEAVVEADERTWRLRRGQQLPRSRVTELRLPVFAQDRAAQAGIGGG